MEHDRWAKVQGRLRSNEPTQIFVCAVFGALVIGCQSRPRNPPLEADGAIRGRVVDPR